MSATTTTTETVADRTPMYSWFVLFVLCSVYILNFLDRQLVAILGELIKEDLNLTDEQLGMLGGIAGTLAAAGQTRIANDAVSVSYPGFWADLTRATGAAPSTRKVTVADASVLLALASST